MNLHRAFFLLLAILSSILSPISSVSKEVGRFPLQNFSHRDYRGHSQNWAVVQDHRGLIYVANNSGVLEFDGIDWRTISANNVLVRCLDVDSYGRVWLGGQDELGYLAADSTGNMRYYSLVGMLGSECKPFGLVRQVYATPMGVFFSTNSCIIQIRGSEVNIIKPSTQFHRTYYVANRIFSVQPGIGLTVLQNNTMQLVPGGELFDKSRIYCMLPFGTDRVLVGTQSDGFFLYHLNALSETNFSDRKKAIIPFHTSNSNFFKQNWVYAGVALADGYFAIGTYRGGAVILNSEGEIVRYIDRTTGLQDETVWYINTDNQENIWFALNNGVSFTSVVAPITNWGEESGIKGVLQSVERYKGSIFATTNSGVYRLLPEGSFKRIEGIQNLSWGLKAVKSADDQLDLLVGTSDGVYKIEGDKALLLTPMPCYSIYQSKFQKNILYLGLNNGIGVMVRDKGSWRFVGAYSGTSGRVHSIDEDDEGNLWFISRYEAVFRAHISNPESLVFDDLQQFPVMPHYSKLDEDAQIRNVMGSMKVSSEKGLARYLSHENAFIPDSSLGKEFADGTMGIRIFGADGRDFLWFEAFKEPFSRWIERAYINDDGTFTRLYAEFSSIPRMIFYAILPEADGSTWFAGSDGLYRFDPKERPRGRRLPRVLLRRVEANGGAPIFNGAFTHKCSDGSFHCTGNSQPSGTIPEIDYEKNSIVFFYSSPYFEQNNRTKFSYQLEGFDNKWSEWTTATKKEYTNLSYGVYTFHLKAQNLFEVESPVVTFTFEVKRPWYFSPFAYVAYLLVLVLIVIMSMGLKTRMLQNSNIKLKELVSERTKEIVSQQKWILEINEQLAQQKEEIQTHRDELMTQNKNIRSSLYYAVTIQQSILPEKTLFNQLFENFIIYIPKDVVSGDFYWMSHWPLKGKNSEKVFLAVVDCTGHGVPGAFMSMIGSRLLSEIVNERKICNPSQILTELDKAVNVVLHQKSSENFDGMDVCLCRIDYKTSGDIVVTFSGANRSLYYNRKGSNKMEMLKGNRKSIGGNMPDIDSDFVNKRITLEPGDSIFLYTDGMADQNNSIKKKFTTCRLNTVILSHIDKPLDRIGAKLLDEFYQFKEEVSQRDDITVIGIRLPKQLTIHQS